MGSDHALDHPFDPDAGEISLSTLEAMRERCLTVRPPQTPIVQPREEHWLGKLDASGQTPYSDERYWAIIAEVSDTTGTAADQITVTPLAGTRARYKQVTATNLDELVSHTHALAEGTIVHVWKTYDQQAPGVARYYFQRMITSACLWRAFAALNVVSFLDGAAEVWTYPVYKLNTRTATWEGGEWVYTWTRQQAVAYLAFGFDPTTKLTTAMPADLTLQTVMNLIRATLAWFWKRYALPVADYPKLELAWVTEAYYVDGDDQIDWDTQPAVATIKTTVWTDATLDHAASATSGNFSQGGVLPEHFAAVQMPGEDLDLLEEGPFYGIRLTATIGDPDNQDGQTVSSSISLDDLKTCFLVNSGGDWAGGAPPWGVGAAPFPPEMTPL